MRGMMPARATPRAGATSRAVVRGRSSAFATSRRGRGSGRSARATRVGDGEGGRAVIGLVARGRSVVASRARWSTTTTVKAREWLGRASLSGTTTARAAATIATTTASEDEESENALSQGQIWLLTHLHNVTEPTHIGDVPNLSNIDMAIFVAAKDCDTPEEVLNKKSDILASVDNAFDAINKASL